MPDPNEPSAVALKAAYLVLRELNKSPEPPSLERLAAILQDTLNYTTLVAMIEDAYDMTNHGYSFDRFDPELQQAHNWISEMLY